MSNDFLMTNLDKNDNVGHGRWFPKIKQRHCFCKNYDDDVIGVFPSNLDIISKLNRFHSELFASTRKPTDEIFFSSSSLSLDQNKLSVSTKRWPVANFHQSGRRRRKREFSLFVMLDLSMCGKLFLKYWHRSIFLKRRVQNNPQSIAISHIKIVFCTQQTQNYHKIEDEKANCPLMEFEPATLCSAI